jgi:hypothetical protein
MLPRTTVEAVKIAGFIRSDLASRPETSSTLSVQGAPDCGLTTVIVTSQGRHCFPLSVTLSDPSSLASIQHRLACEYRTTCQGSLDALIATLPDELALELVEPAPPITVRINSPCGVELSSQGQGLDMSLGRREKRPRSVQIL